MDEKKVRQLAAVMFTDIVGYTALMQEDEQMAAKVRARHREVFQQQHALFKGEILQYYGLIFALKYTGAWAVTLAGLVFIHKSTFSN